MITKKRLIPVVAYALGAAGLAACVTVNIYFPAAEIREAAEEIVEETWGGEGGTRGSAAPAATLRWLAGLLGPDEAMAAEPDLDVSTAAIRALKDAMKARSAQIKPHLGAGHAGIASNGLLVPRDVESLSLQEKAGLRRLLDAENRDRMSLYKEIAAANDLADSHVANIQEIFAETWRKKADRGWWVQDAAGSWSQR